MQKIIIRNNKLVWGGKVVEELAERYGTPLYIYDEKILIQRIKELKKGPWKIHYALKANPSPECLKTMRKFGIGIDAVSFNEVSYALKMGFKPKDIVYTSSSLSDVEAKKVISQKVLVNLNSIEEIELYGRIGKGTDIGIRINPQVKAGHHSHVQTSTEISKFGILLNDVARAVEVAKKYNLKITMVHFHIGSGILSSDLFIKAFKNVLSLISDLELPDLVSINLGGGFGTPYLPSEKRLNLKSLIGRTKKLHKEFTKKNKRRIELYIEPGRYLVNECCLLAVNVNTVSRNQHRTFYRIDSGFNHLVRPILYNSYHHAVNASRVNGKKERAVLSGNICEAGDIINQKPRSLTLAQPNDKIAILDTGAYGVSMGMEAYNLRGLPAEIMIKGNGKVVQFAYHQDLDTIIDRYRNYKG